MLQRHDLNHFPWPQIQAVAHNGEQFRDVSSLSAHAMGRSCCAAASRTASRPQYESTPLSVPAPALRERHQSILCSVAGTMHSEYAKDQLISQTLPSAGPRSAAMNVRSLTNLRIPSLPLETSKQYRDQAGIERFPADDFAAPFAALAALSLDPTDIANVAEPALNTNVGTISRTTEPRLCLTMSAAQPYSCSPTSFDDDGVTKQTISPQRSDPNSERNRDPWRGTTDERNDQVIASQRAGQDAPTRDQRDLGTGLSEPKASKSTDKRSAKRGSKRTGRGRRRSRKGQGSRGSTSSPTDREDAVRWFTTPITRNALTDIFVSTSLTRRKTIPTTP